MGYVGNKIEDMLVQKAYANLRNRGYQYPLNSCYYKLLGVLQREGEKALEEYVEAVKIE